MAALVVALLAALLAAAGACAKQDLSSELDRARSWTATARLAAQRRRAGAINGAAARQLGDRAAEARSQAARSLSQLATSDSERAAARGALDSLRHGILQLHGAER